MFGSLLRFCSVNFYVWVAAAVGIVIHYVCIVSLRGWVAVAVDILLKCEVLCTGRFCWNDFVCVHLSCHIPGAVFAGSTVATETMQNSTWPRNERNKPCCPVKKHAENKKRQPRRQKKTG